MLVSTLCSQLMAMAGIFKTFLTQIVKLNSKIQELASRISTFLEKMGIYRTNLVRYSRTNFFLQDLLKSKLSLHTLLLAMDTLYWMLATKANGKMYSMGKSICKLTKLGRRGTQCMLQTKLYFGTIGLDTTDQLSTKTIIILTQCKSTLKILRILRNTSRKKRKKHTNARFAGYYLVTENICGEWTRSLELISLESHWVVKEPSMASLSTLTNSKISEKIRMSLLGLTF